MCVYEHSDETIILFEYNHKLLKYTSIFLRCLELVMGGKVSQVYMYSIHSNL